MARKNCGTIVVLLNNEQLNEGGKIEEGKAEWENMTSNKMYSNS